MPLFKLNQKHKDLWIAWSDLLNNELRETALETLVEENLTKEVSELIETNGQLYVHGWFVGTPKPSTDRSINVIHRHLKNLCLERVEGEILYDLEIPKDNTKKERPPKRDKM